MAKHDTAHLKNIVKNVKNLLKLAKKKKKSVSLDDIIKKAPLICFHDGTFISQKKKVKLTTEVHTAVCFSTCLQQKISLKPLIWIS